MITCILLGQGIGKFLRIFYCPFAAQYCELVKANDELLKCCGISAGQVLKIKLASGQFLAKSIEVRLKLKVQLILLYLRLLSGFVHVFVFLLVAIN